jgi:hypothetical protein
MMGSERQKRLDFLVPVRLQPASEEGWGCECGRCARVLWPSHGFRLHELRPELTLHAAYFQHVLAAMQEVTRRLAEQEQGGTRRSAGHRSRLGASVTLTWNGVKETRRSS